MIAYKGFNLGLICRGYQFTMGRNTTAEANCAHNGFHCAEDPLDCLCYYSDMDRSEYYLVQPGGDIDEDEDDSKIACTELTIIKKLERKEFSSTLWPTWWTIRSGNGAVMSARTTARLRTAMWWSGVLIRLLPGKRATFWPLRRRLQKAERSSKSRWFVWTGRKSSPKVGTMSI